ncbi:class I SAM-dependent methyltransferase [Halobacteriovorax sp. RZ-1]|uniref:class I SAM-dependent methyltransferase n=1 Tax=unclassified Halobacteriovorax TaxID=2639665 RepID=UPI00371375B7
MFDLEKNTVLDDLIKCNAIENGDYELFSNKTRDADIRVIKDKKSGVIFLETLTHTGEGQYEDNAGFSYWGKDSREQALLNTFEDDNRRYNSIKENIKQGPWLDIGTGLGGILELAKKDNQSNIYGLEIQRQAREGLCQLGFNIFGSLNDIEIKFKTISLFHVFEHISEQLNFLKDIKSVLDDDGTLIIEVPHANDALLSKYRCEAFKNFTLWSEHLVLHTEDSLVKVLEYAGYKIDKVDYIQRYNIANHMYWLSEGKPGGHKVYNDMSSSVELVECYNKYLENNKITDTIYITASKG